MECIHYYSHMDVVFLFLQQTSDSLKWWVGVCLLLVFLFLSARRAKNVFFRDVVEWSAIALLLYESSPVAVWSWGLALIFERLADYENWRFGVYRRSWKSTIMEALRFFIQGSNPDWTRGEEDVLEFEGSEVEASQIRNLDNQSIRRYYQGAIFSVLSCACWATALVSFDIQFESAQQRWFYLGLLGVALGLIGIALAGVIQRAFRVIRLQRQALFSNWERRHLMAVSLQNMPGLVPRHFPLFLIAGWMVFGYWVAFVLLAGLFFLALHDKNQFSESSWWVEEIVERNATQMATLPRGHGMGTLELIFMRFQFIFYPAAAIVLEFHLIMWWWWFRIIAKDGLTFLKRIRPDLPQARVFVYAVMTDYRWGWDTCLDLLEKQRFFSFGWLYRPFYLDQAHGIQTAVEILDTADACVIAFPVDGNGLVGSLTTFGAMNAALQRPLRTIDFVLAGNHVPWWEQRIDTEVEYALRILDERVVPLESDLGRHFSVDCIRLNAQAKEQVQRVIGMEWQGISKRGLVELNVLHRRVHEFPLAATRFIELLNIWELIPRWIIILEKLDDFENYDLDLEYSFGASVKAVVSSPFMEEKLTLNDQLVEQVRLLWKRELNYTEKIKTKPTVAELFWLVVFVRNKTRGHGSPSRISEDFYVCLETLTFMILRLFNVLYDYEVVVYDSELGSSLATYRRGMEIKFLKSEGVAIMGLPTTQQDGIYFRKVGSVPWFQSNQLRALNGHIFLLNGIKKGKPEWICFSTGELIRPTRIYGAEPEM